MTRCRPRRVEPGFPGVLRRLGREAAARGLSLYAVGGCVRDWILGRKTKDIDLAVEGDPERFATVACRQAGRAGALPEAHAGPMSPFKTWTLESKRLRIDFAMTRQEEYPSPAVLPHVSPAPLQEDLRRRDFTINAMAVSLDPGRWGELVDPHGGYEDLRSRTLRPLHAESFRDDPTRVFRAARFLARLGLRPSPGLYAMAREALARGYPRLLSRHRILTEFWRILAEKEPRAAFRVLRELGYLDLVGPGLGATLLKPLPPSLRSPEERFAAHLASLGARRGARLLDSLPVERALARECREMLAALDRKSAPLKPLPALARTVLRALHPEWPGAALSPILVNGRDLAALGIAPGKSYGEILSFLGRMQWRGVVRSRKEALRRLRLLRRSRP